MSENEHGEERKKLDQERKDESDNLFFFEQSCFILILETSHYSDESAN